MKKTLLLMLMVFMSISSLWATKYELVTSATQLVAGCKYIIADGTSNNVNVISTESNTNNRRTTTGTVANSSITATDAMMVFELGGSSNAWTFTTTNYLGTDGYLYNNDTNNNRLFVGNNTTENKFTISFSNNAISSITCNGNTSRGVMCFNGNLVACYTSKSSNYKVPQLYKESSEVTTEYDVTISNDIQNGTVSANVSKAAANTTVTLTATPASGYKFDSWNVTNASTSTAITVTNNQFTMPAANVNVSAKFVEKTVNPNEITYDFNDVSAYPTDFPTAKPSESNASTSGWYTINGNSLYIKASSGENFYIINYGTDDSRGLFYGKSLAANGKPSDGTAYLGFPALPGKKLVKVVATTTKGVAGSVKMNIYTTDWTAKSTELSTSTSTKKEFTFELSETEANTEYRLASGSSGKNLQFDNIVLTYEEVGATSTTITIGSTGYSTYFDSEHAYTMPEDCEGYVFTLDNGFEVAYEGGEVVPAGEPLVIYTIEPGDKTLKFTTTEEETYKSGDMNDLDGTDAETALEADDSAYFYALSKGKAGSQYAGKIGFFWLAENGAAFTNGAHKAYLKVAKTATSKSAFTFDGEATAISNVKADANTAVSYNLAGQRVNANAKGIVIMNGKKCLNK